MSTIKAKELEEEIAPWFTRLLRLLAEHKPDEWGNPKRSDPCAPNRAVFKHRVQQIRDRNETHKVSGLAPSTLEKFLGKKKYDVNRSTVIKAAKILVRIFADEVVKDRFDTLTTEEAFQRVLTDTALTDTKTAPPPSLEIRMDAVHEFIFDELEKVSTKKVPKPKSIESKRSANPYHYNGSLSFPLQQLLYIKRISPNEKKSESPKSVEEKIQAFIFENKAFRLYVRGDRRMGKSSLLAWLRHHLGISSWYLDFSAIDVALTHAEALQELLEAEGLKGKTLEECAHHAASTGGVFLIDEFDAPLGQPEFGARVIDFLAAAQEKAKTNSIGIVATGKKAGGEVLGEYLKRQQYSDNNVNLWKSFELENFGPSEIEQLAYLAPVQLQHMLSASSKDDEKAIALLRQKTKGLPAAVQDELSQLTKLYQDRKLTFSAMFKQLRKPIATIQLGDF